MDENNIVERDRYGGGSVMILGGMLVCHGGKTELVSVNGRLNARRYCDEIIIPVVIPVLEELTFCRKTTLTVMLLVTQCSALLQQSNIQTLDSLLHVIRSLINSLRRQDSVSLFSRAFFPLLLHFVANFVIAYNVDFIQ